MGKLENLAPGENIYSARFTGNKGFLVTFVKVDPLFTLDLSDPANPKLIGELKIPGYSDYIHPLGDNHLLTIGKDAILYESRAWYQGLQLSIFDVSGFKNPVLVHKEQIGVRGTESEALHNHKAFTYWEEKNLLAIPVRLYEHQNEQKTPQMFGTQTFSGLYIYKVHSDDGFTFMGRIASSETASQYSMYSSWTRGLFVNSRIYAVTPDSVHSVNVENIDNSVEALSIK